ncbi:MAG: alkaline phosphatase family protein, partial [Candidatus Binataceae bacterium]
LIAEVYNALRANEPLWMNSLLVVLYDEHGGIYDHVIPPAGPPHAIAPDHHTEEFTFDRFGVRVPAILVSPYMDKRVLPTVFDHTSLLKYLIDKWKLGSLGARAAAANSFASALRTTARSDTPLAIDSTGAAASGNPGPAVANRRASLSTNQSALFGMTQLLESATDSAAGDLSSRLKRMVTGFDGQVDVAIERTDRFLEQQRKRV